MNVTKIVGIRFPYTGNCLRNHCLNGMTACQRRAAEFQKKTTWRKSYDYESHLELDMAKEFLRYAQKFEGYRETVFWLNQDDRLLIALPLDAE